MRHSLSLSAFDRPDFAWSSQAPGVMPDSGWPELLSVMRNCTSANAPSVSGPPFSGLASNTTDTPSRTSFCFSTAVAGSAAGAGFPVSAARLCH
ncbi:hypothetical protein D3C76_1293730 [compost metagenome]